MKTIKIADCADSSLSALSKHRKASGKIVKTKQDIISELVAIAFCNELTIDEQMESVNPL